MLDANKQEYFSRILNYDDINIFNDNYDSTFISLMRRKYFNNINFVKTPIVAYDGDDFYSIDAFCKDTKHEDAFRRMIKKYPNTRFSDLVEYYINIKDITVTGFDLSKFLAANGYLVFCHSNILNYFNDVRAANVIFPLKLSKDYVGKIILLNKIAGDEDNIDLTFASSHFKNSSDKVIYERLFDNKKRYDNEEKKNNGKLL